MKVLAINGEESENGVTQRALEEICRVLKEKGIESEVLMLGKDPIQGCRGCGKCIKRKKCFFEGAVNTVNEQSDEFDALLIGCPVHYGEASMQVLHFLDRMFQSGKGCWVQKPAAAVVTCRSHGGEEAADMLNRYFLTHHMPVVPSQQVPILRGYDAAEASGKEEELQNLRMLAENMAWLLRCLEAAGKAGIPLPEHETSIRPYFVR